MSAPTGLRELKKARSRQHIAGTAARLFAQRGYEQVTIDEVAREAEVAPQTIYNYFPSKAHLVTDRDDFVRERMSRLIRTRSPGTSPAAAIRPLVLGVVDSMADVPADQWPGELGYLALVSPTVRRLALDTVDRLAALGAEAILDTSDVTPAVARLQGIALAGVFKIVLDECGLRTRDGQARDQLVDELRALVEEVLDELDRWLQT